MKLLIIASLTLVVVGCGDSSAGGTVDQDAGTVTLSGEGGDDGNPNRPLPIRRWPGQDTAVFAGDVVGEVRVGETRTFPLVVTSYSPNDVIFPLSLRDTYSAGTGVTVSSVPSSVTVPAGGQVVIDVTVTVDATSEPGFESFDVAIFDPADPDGFAIESPRLGVRVVDAAAVLGPLVGEDVAVVAPEAVSTWDVLANDAAGDAALDLASLKVLTQPRQGYYGPVSVTANTDGTVTIDLSAVSAHDIGIFDATYEICDTNNNCSTTDLHIQPTRPRT